MIEQWADRSGQIGRRDRAEFWSSCGASQGVVELAEFKATLVDQYLGGLRAVLDDAGGGRIQMAPTAFPPPWSFVSGLDFNRAARHCDELAVKLYSMHWLMMARFYGDQLLQANPGLSSQRLAKCLIQLLDIADNGPEMRVEDFHYPAPEEPHQIGEAPQRRKIQTAQQAAGETPIRVLAHGYGPLDDFRNRINIASRASEYGFWVNRYGYLADEKLDAIGQAAGNAAR